MGPDRKKLPPLLPPTGPGRDLDPRASERPTIERGPQRPSQQRLIRQRHARGRAAEDAAADFLSELGYDIIGRNVRVGRLEIDLLARDGSAVVVIEVRTRQAGSWFGGIGSVTLEKRRRLRRAGHSLWMARFAADTAVQTMRFDIVSVHLEASSPARFEHIRAAF